MRIFISKIRGRGGSVGWTVCVCLALGASPGGILMGGRCLSVNFSSFRLSSFAGPEWELRQVQPFCWRFIGSLAF